MIKEEIECDSKFPPRFYVSGWDPFGYRLKDGTVLTVFVTSNDPHRLASFQVMSVAEHDAVVAEHDAVVAELETIHQDNLCLSVEGMKYRKKLKTACQALQKIADEYFSDNRPHSATVAYEALKKIRGEE